jgi:hypothetical protein
MRIPGSSIAEIIKQEAVDAIAKGAIIKKYAAGGNCSVDSIAFNEQNELSIDDTKDFLAKLQQFARSAAIQTESDNAIIAEYIKYIHYILDSIERQRQHGTLCQAFLELAVHNGITALTSTIRQSSSSTRVIGQRALSAIDTLSFAQNTSSAVMADLQQFKYADVDAEDRRSEHEPTGYTSQIIEPYEVTIDASTWHNFTAGVSGSTSMFCSWFDRKNKALKKIHADGLKRFPHPGIIPLSYMQIQIKNLIQITAQKRSKSLDTTKSFRHLQNAIAGSDELKSVAPDFNENALKYNPQPQACLPMQLNSTTKLIIRSPINIDDLEDSTGEQETTHYEHHGLISQVKLTEVIPANALQQPINFKGTCRNESWSWHAEIQKIISPSDELWLTKQVNLLIETQPMDIVRTRASQLLERTTLARYSGESLSRMCELLNKSDKLTILADMSATLHDLEQNALYYADISPANLLWDGERARFCDFDSIMHPLAAYGCPQPSSTYPHQVSEDPRFSPAYAHKMGIITILYYLADKDKAEEFITKVSSENYSSDRYSTEQVTAYEKAIQQELTMLSVHGNPDQQQLATLGLQLLHIDSTIAINSAIRGQIEQAPLGGSMNTRDSNSVVEHALQSTASNDLEERKPDLIAYWESLSPSLHFNERYQKLANHILTLNQPRKRSMFSCLGRRSPPVARSNSASLIYNPHNHRQGSLFRSMENGGMPGLGEIDLGDSMCEPEDRSSRSQSLCVSDLSLGSSMHGGGSSNSGSESSSPDVSFVESPRPGSDLFRERPRSQAVTRQERYMAAQYGARY